MKKGTMQADIAETLLELGTSTAKQSAKAVTRTLNPMQVLDNKSGVPGFEGKPMEQVKEGMNASPLKLDQLKDKYKDQDKVQLEAMRGRLFKLVKEGEEKAIAERKQEEEERKKQDAMEEQEKLKQQQAAAQQPLETPQGKPKRGMMNAHKKKAMEQHAETKPSTSKG